MGRVYLARDPRLNRTVALKVLAVERANHPEAQERLRREARAIASLNHPHICAPDDFGSLDGFRLSRHGAPPGRDPPDAALTRLAQSGRGARIPAIPDRGSARLRAPRRDRPPRPEARQRHAHAERRPSCWTSALRPPPRCPTSPLNQIEGEPAHRDRRDAGHAALYGAGTTAMAASADARTDLFASGLLLFETVTGHDGLRRKEAREPRRRCFATSRRRCLRCGRRPRRWTASSRVF